MIAVLLAAILFGLVHPGSKLIINLGITLIPFCLLYIGIRILVQIPIVLKSGDWKVRSKAQGRYLISLGLVGAALQFTEFYGVADGLPVSIVSFLVYTHPVWTLIFSSLLNKERLTLLSFFKIFLAVAGICLITGASLSVVGNIGRFVVPLVAGIMIALWITLSNCAAKTGASTRTISFYYDLIAFIAMSVLSYSVTSVNGFIEAANFLKTPLNLFLVCVYSILIGLVPNYLFYFGSKTVPALMAGLMLLIEPVVSAVVAHLAWKEPVSTSFGIGALCILFANVPQNFILRVKAKYLSSRFNKSKIIVVFITCSLLFLPGNLCYAAMNYQKRPVLHVVEIVPIDTSNYTVTAELNQIRESFKLAHEDYKKINSKCELDIDYFIKRGTENELYSYVKKISKSEKSPMAIGFSRSTFARIAAKAAVGTNLKGIAVGASTTNLRKINPNFVSVASPRILQWSAVYEKMQSLQSCSRTKSFGVFDSRSHLSVQFKEDYQRAGFNEFQESSPELGRSFYRLIKDKSCVFIALNFSDAQIYLEQLIAKKWKGSVFGIGDWNMFSNEIHKMFYETKHKGVTAYLPTGWRENMTKYSKEFSIRMKKRIGLLPSPIGAYSYDAMLIALGSICGSMDYQNPKPDSLSTLRVLRNYDGISETGNYLSKMMLVQLESGGN